jgi:hypothetical protein
MLQLSSTYRKPPQIEKTSSSSVPSGCSGKSGSLERSAEAPGGPRLTAQTSLTDQCVEDVLELDPELGHLEIER